MRPVGLLLLGLAALGAPFSSNAKDPGWDDPSAPGLEPPGTKPPAATPSRHLDTETGVLTLQCDGNDTIITVTEDIRNDYVYVLWNGDLMEFSSAQVTHFVVELCGMSNSFKYQLAASTTVLDRLRTFDIQGGDGFDYVTIDLANNLAGVSVSWDVAPTITADLGGLSDHVEIPVYEFGPGTLNVDVQLGTGDDSFTMIGYGKPMHGSLDMAVEGEGGDDMLYVDLLDGWGTDIPAGERILAELSGDTLDHYGNTNAPVHGADRIEFVYRGAVHGDLDVNLLGDDGIARIIEPECWSGACFFTYAVPFECQVVFPPPPQPCTLEDALRAGNGYANDLVAALVEITDSTGEVRVYADGGIASDDTVLIFNGTETPDALDTWSAWLTGGTQHKWKHDRCYTDSHDADITNCEEETGAIVPPGW